MTDIPEDIMRAARELLDGYAEDAVMAAARAILAERERCAQIAESINFRDLWDVVTPSQWTEITDDDGEVCGKMLQGEMRRLNARRVIAAAIRSPERAGE